MANDIGRFGTAPITSESEKPVERPAEEQKPYLNWGLTRPAFETTRRCWHLTSAPRPSRESGMSTGSRRTQRAGTAE
jgi:hypothetical protein